MVTLAHADVEAALVAVCLAERLARARAVTPACPARLLVAAVAPEEVFAAVADELALAVVFAITQLQPVADFALHLPAHRARLVLLLQLGKGNYCVCDVMSGRLDAT